MPIDFVEDKIDFVADDLQPSNRLQDEEALDAMLGRQWSMARPGMVSTEKSTTAGGPPVPLPDQSPFQLLSDREANGLRFAPLDPEPRINIAGAMPQVDEKNDTALTAGMKTAAQGVASLPEFFTSDAGVSTVVLSAMPWFKPFVGAYWAKDLLGNAYETAKNSVNNWDQMTDAQKGQAVVSVAMETAMGAMSIGLGIGPSKRKISPAALGETVSKIPKGPEGAATAIDVLQSPKATPVEPVNVPPLIPIPNAPKDESPVSAAMAAAGESVRSAPEAMQTDVAARLQAGKAAPEVASAEASSRAQEAIAKGAEKVEQHEGQPNAQNQIDQASAVSAEPGKPIDAAAKEQSQIGTEVGGSEGGAARHAQPEVLLSKTGVFQPDEILEMRSPHTGDVVDVSYRGPLGDKSVVWTGKTQMAIPTEWLSRKGEYEKQLQQKTLGGVSVSPLSSGGGSMVQKPMGETGGGESSPYIGNTTVVHPKTSETVKNTASMSKSELVSELIGQKPNDYASITAWNKRKSSLSSWKKSELASRVESDRLTKANESALAEATQNLVAELQKAADSAGKSWRTVLNQRLESEGIDYRFPSDNSKGEGVYNTARAIASRRLKEKTSPEAKEAQAIVTKELPDAKPDLVTRAIEQEGKDHPDLPKDTLPVIVRDELKADAKGYAEAIEKENPAKAEQTVAQSATVEGKPVDIASWIGKSKAVDESGKPMMVFHGTDKDFSQFNTPAFFTTNPTEAKRFYADRSGTRYGRVVSAYLKAENPFIPYENGSKKLHSLWEKYDGLIDVAPYEKDFQKQLKAEGFDSIKQKTDKHNEQYFVVFDKDQVRTADGSVEKPVEAKAPEPPQSAVGKVDVRETRRFQQQAIDDLQASKSPAIWIDEQVITPKGKYDVDASGKLKRTQELSVRGFEKNLDYIIESGENNPQNEGQWWGANKAAKERIEQIKIERAELAKTQAERKAEQERIENEKHALRTAYDEEVAKIELPKGKKQIVTIPTEDQTTGKKGTKHEPMTVFGNLGIRKNEQSSAKSGYKYFVTHVPTGLSVGNELKIKTLEHAKTYIKALIHTGVDLSKKKFSSDEMHRLSEAKRATWNENETQPPDFWKPTEQPSQPMRPGPGAATAPMARGKDLAPPEFVEGTALKNAVGELERVGFGLPKSDPVKRQKVAEAWIRSGEITAKDQLAGKRIVDELEANPNRGLSDVDSALVLREKVRIENEMNNAAEKTITETDPTLKAAAQGQWEKLQKELLKVLDAAKHRGSSWGREGVWRQVVAREDYSLAGLQRRTMGALGRKLTTEEYSQLKDLADKYQKLSGELEGKLEVEGVARRRAELALAELEKQFKNAPKFDQKVIEYAEKFVSRLEVTADRYAKELRGAVWSPTPDMLAKATFIGATRIMRGTLEVGKWTAEMVGILGEGFRKHADEVYQMSLKERDKLLAGAPEKVRRKIKDSTPDQRIEMWGEEIKERLSKDDKASIHGLIRKIAYALVEKGVHQREPLVDAVYNFMQRVAPEMSRRQVMDAISGYGEFGQLSKDATSLILRDLKGQMQQVGKLEDMAGGNAPKKTGFERRTPSDEERRLIQQVEEAKRRGGYKVTDPEAQLKTAMDAVKTRLTNQIKDLETQIANREKIVKKRTRLEYDEQAKSLQARRDELKAVFDEMFPKEPLTEAQRLQRWKDHLDKRISEFERRVREKDFSKKEVRQRPALDNEALAAMEKLQQVKEEYHELLLKKKYRDMQLHQKAWVALKEANNIPRNIMTSADFSAVLRQGGILAGAHPIRAAKALGPMFKAFASEKNAGIVEQEILHRPNAKNGLYSQGKLYLSPLKSTTMSAMEEQVFSRFAHKVPLVRRSNRAFIVFLNKLRADSFDAFVEHLESGGKELTPAELKAVGNYINVATGRGALGSKYEAAAEGLSTVLFSPRLMASRFQILAGQPLYRGSARTRMLVAKEYAKALGALATFIGLGYMAGADVEHDPRSSDFAKLKFGNTRLDPGAGLSQSVVFMTRNGVVAANRLSEYLFGQPVTRGEIKSVKGRVRPLGATDLRYGEKDYSSVLGTFLRQKIAPVIGAVIDIGTKQNLVGKKASIPDYVGTVKPLGETMGGALEGTAVENVPVPVPGTLTMPLSFQDIFDMMKENGVAPTVALQVLSIFGMGVQNFEGSVPKAGYVK